MNIANLNTIIAMLQEHTVANLTEYVAQYDIFASHTILDKRCIATRRSLLKRVKELQLMYKLTDVNINGVSFILNATPDMLENLKEILKLDYLHPSFLDNIELYTIPKRRFYNNHFGKQLVNELNEKYPLLKQTKTWDAWFNLLIKSSDTIQDYLNKIPTLSFYNQSHLEDRLETDNFELLLVGMATNTVDATDMPANLLLSIHKAKGFNTKVCVRDSIYYYLLENNLENVLLNLEALLVKSNPDVSEYYVRPHMKDFVEKFKDETALTYFLYSVYIDNASEKNPVKSQLVNSVKYLEFKRTSLNDVFLKYDLLNVEDFGKFLSRAIPTPQFRLINCFESFLTISLFGKAPHQLNLSELYKNEPILLELIEIKLKELETSRKRRTALGGMQYTASFKAIRPELAFKIDEAKQVIYLHSINALDSHYIGREIQVYSVTPVVCSKIQELTYYILTLIEA